MLINLFQSVRKLDYGSLLIESLVLIVGVFLALQAENWNEQRKENIETEAYYARLQQDFSSIQYQAKKIIEEIDREIAATEGLSEIIGRNLDAESIAAASEYLEELIYISSCQPLCYLHRNAGRQ